MIQIRLSFKQGVWAVRIRRSRTYSTTTRTGSEADGIFDGMVEIIAVIDVPVYVRKVYLP